MATAAGVPRPVRISGYSNGLGRFFKVKSGEGTSLLLLGGTMLSIEAGYWLGSNGLDALVFSQYGSGALPWLLIGKGLLGCLSLTLYSYGVGRVNRAWLLAVTTTIIVIGLFIARLAINSDPPGAVLFLIWTLGYVIPDLLGIQAWSLARQVFDSRQSKRLFPLITAGDTIGIVVGNFLTAPLAGLLGVPNLLLGWAFLTFLAFIMMRPLQRLVDLRDKRPKTRQQRNEQNGSVLSQFRLGYTIIRYYPMMGLVAITTALNALLYWVLWLPYIRVSTEAFPNNPAALAGFFGAVAGSATIASFLFSLLVLNRLFTRFGIRNFVMVTATINTIGFILIGPVLNLAFAAVIAFRFFQIVSRQSVTTSTTQTLYNLVPPEAREVAGNFNQAVSLQAGMGLAGIILFLTPAVGIPIILFLAIALSIFYLITSLRIRNLYKPSLVQLLREGQQEFFGHEDLDESGNFSGGSGTDEAINVALVGLKDPYEGSRRLSAELLGRMARPEVVPFLITAISNDKSPDVRRACIVALSQLSGQDAFHSIAQHLADPDAGVRAQAAASLRNTGAELEQMSLFFLRRALNDQNPVVCREAIFTISAYGYHKEALYALWEMGRHPEMEVRAEAAIAYGVIGEQDDPLILKELLILLRDSDSIVRAKAARAISRFSDPKAVNALIYTLEDESPAVREEAAHSLARMHQVSASTILRYLAISINENGQHAALRTLTLARLDYLDSSRTLLPERSGEVVSQDLKIEPPVKSGKLVIDEIKSQKLVEYGKRQLEIARRMSDYLRSLGKLDMNSTAWRTNGRRPKRDPANLALLQKSLRARYQSAVDRLIAVVGLLGNVEAIELAGENLRNRAERDASRKRADAIETFENFGDDYLTPALISLLEEDEQGEAALPSKPRTLAETLYEIWLENDRWLRACILHVIGLFSLNKLKPLVLDALKLDPTKEQLIYESALEAQQNLDLTTDNNNSENSMQTLTSLSTLSRILFLQKVPIFSSLSPEDLRRVAVVSDERLYTPGEFLCYEGEAGDELYIIVSGQVQVLAGYTGKTDEPATNVKTLYTATEGEVLGEMAILEDIPRTATLRAYNAPVRILALGGIEFKRILRERPELAIEIIRVLSRWLRETNRRVQNAPSLEEAPAS